MVFMLLGALPFVIYIQIAHGRGAAVWNNSEVRAFLGIVVAVSLTVTVWLWLVRDERLVDAFRLVTFNVVSVVTTTGFATTDYGQWGGLAVVVFFILTFIGGCRSEEHTSELQSLMRISYAVFCLKK